MWFFFGFQISVILLGLFEPIQALYIEIAVNLNTEWWLSGKRNLLSEALNRKILEWRF